MDATPAAIIGDTQKKSSAQIDQTYINRGRMLYLTRDPSWDEGLSAANNGKRGAPYRYPDGLIECVAGIRALYNFGYRQSEGLITEAFGEENAPDHTTIFRRINKMKVDIKHGAAVVQNKNSAFVLIPDATGLEPCERGFWIRKLYGKERSGYIKLHIMINGVNLKITAFRVTDERKSDASQLPELLDESLKTISIDDIGNALARHVQQKADAGDCADGAAADAAANNDASSCGKPESAAANTGQQENNSNFNHNSDNKKPKNTVIMLGDGAYDTGDVAAYTTSKGVIFMAKVRKNSTGRANGKGRARMMAVREQLGGGNITSKEFAKLSTKKKAANHQDWMLKIGYGKRWLVEIVFSAFKRVFGFSVRAKKLPNIIQEIAIKIQQYNRLRDMAAGVIAETD